MAASARRLARIGLRAPFSTAWAMSRRMKSCWRLIRPMSEVGSDRHRPGFVVLEVAGADPGQGLLAVERLAAGGLDVEARPAGSCGRSGGRRDGAGTYMRTPPMASTIVRKPAKSIWA